MSDEYLGYLLEKIKLSVYDIIAFASLLSRSLGRIKALKLLWLN